MMMREYCFFRRRFVIDRDAARTLIEWYAPPNKGWSLYLWPCKRLMWHRSRTLSGWNIDIGPVELFTRGRV
jgi:hypothetical protein